MTFTPSQSRPILSVHSIQQADSATLKVVGELDCYSAAELGAAIDRELGRRRNVTLDMSGVGFMDSAGIGVLIRGYKAAVVAGRSFAVTTPSSPVRRVLDITGQSKRFLAE